jgi:hypothetical protein
LADGFPVIGPVLEIPFHDESATAVYVKITRRLIIPPGEKDDAATSDRRDK